MLARRDPPWGPLILIFKLLIFLCKKKSIKIINNYKNERCPMAHTSKLMEVLKLLTRVISLEVWVLPDMPALRINIGSKIPPQR